MIKIQIILELHGLQNGCNQKIIKNNINNQSIPIFTGKHVVTSLDDYIIALNPGNEQEMLI